MTEAEKDRDDLIRNHHSPLHGAASTGITLGSSAVAGMIDGYFAARGVLGGMFPVTGMAGAAAAVTAIFVPDPSLKELLNAVARGTAAPAIYEGSRRYSLQKFNPDIAAQLAKVDAAAAAKAAAPGSPAAAAAAAAAA